MVNAAEALSLILVGLFWGCTNPFMRKGFAESKTTKERSSKGEEPHDDAASGGSSIKTFISSTLARLANIKVWIPYIINQLGSLLYYKTLASSNLTLSVPICNATAMVFSSITSALLGERVNQPGRAVLGVSLVLLGVAICMYSNEEGGSIRDGDNVSHGEL
ncbi:hypothetical protein ACHAXR_000241 [Thalassiosira sp. AJA248-18]